VAKPPIYHPCGHRRFRDRSERRQGTYRQ
jgi:hypothetical protein